MTATLQDRTDTNVRPLRESRFDSSLSIFSTVALILLLWGFCWLKNNTSLRPPQFVNVAFHEIAGLSTNAGVFVDGVRVGIVDKIEWAESHRVLVKIRINSDRVVIPIGSKVTILTNGVVGAKYVEIVLPPNSQNATPLTPDIVLQGEDPVRPELAVNNIAIAISEIDFQNVRKNLEEDHDRIVLATDQLTKVMNKSMPLIEKTIPLEDKAIVLTENMTRVSQKMARILDNPNLSGDLKETATQVRITMAHVQDVMKNLNLTLADKDLRTDIVTTMDKLNQATASIQQSMEVVQNMSADKELRGDMKQMLRDARDAMTKVDKIVTDPTFGTDLKLTLSKSRDAIEHIDLAAQQMNQMLDKRSPLLHMMFGRPGRVSIKKKEGKAPAPAEKAPAPAAGIKELLFPKKEAVAPVPVKDPIVVPPGPEPLNKMDVVAPATAGAAGDEVTPSF